MCVIVQFFVSIHKVIIVLIHTINDTRIRIKRNLMQSAPSTITRFNFFLPWKCMNDLIFHQSNDQFTNHVH